MNTRREKEQNLSSRKNAQESQKFNWFLFLHFLGLLCLFVASPVFAYSGGDGSPESPYQIYDVNDLLELSADEPNYSQCFILINDINLAGRVFITSVIAPPTDCFVYTPFTGRFEGAGHKIENLNIDTLGDAKCDIGLFGKISGGEVNNLILENARIKNGDGSTNTGTLAGHNYGGTITDCCSIGTIGIYDLPYRSPQTFVIGGLVGFNQGNINNCTSSVDVNAGYAYDSIGGLVGFNTGTIDHCFASGDVWGAGKSVEYTGSTGGLVGANQGIISNCGATGNVTDSAELYSYAEYGPCGGLAGSNFDYAIISNSYSTGSVNCLYPGGGLVGSNTDAIIIDCFATGNIIGKAELGGLVGTN